MYLNPQIHGTQDTQDTLEYAHFALSIAFFGAMESAGLGGQLGRPHARYIRAT
jgi:hypothetical protein